MIKNIEISKLKAHPNNPRKVIGDVSELAASIKKNGVFQNLTVVPNEDDTYKIIIGHRRHAAAKEAGLTELPCAVIEMTEKEQLSTMLLENMQREDLTVLEQAEGFQMMIDLGESVKSISEQTGFSQSTVRHRVKLLELDKKELRKQESMNVSITDYIKLEKIKSVDRRNEVLKYIGTNNFDYMFNSAINEEKREVSKNKWREKLESLNAIDVSEEREIYSKYTNILSTYILNCKASDFVVQDEHTDKQLYFKFSYGWLYIYVDKPAHEEPDDEETLARKEAELIRIETNNKLSEIGELCKNNREEWMKGYVSKSADLPLIISLMFYCTATDRDTQLDISSFVKDDIDENTTVDDMPIIKDGGQVLLQFVYDSYCDGCTTFDYYNEYCVDDDDTKILVALYDIIQKLGYAPADEELAYIYGSHELYKKEVEEQ